MKASYHAGRGLLRLLTLMTFLVAGNSQVARAAEPEQDGISREDIDAALRAERAKLNARDALSIVGTWENSDRNMSMTFSEGGQFEFQKNSESKAEKGLYKVTSSGNSLVVSVFFFQGKDYFFVTPLSDNRAAWHELKSPEEKPDPDKAVIWTRSPAAPERAETSQPSENAKGEELFALQKPENLIGHWKSVGGSGGVVTTMSFSEDGEFDYAKEKDGKRDDVVKATYTVQRTGGGLTVTLRDGDEKAYYGVAFLSKNRCFKQSLKSPNERVDPDKGGIILNRVP